MSYAEEAAAVSRQEPERHDRRMCCAPGCVLPGAIADATNGATDWYCALHHGAAYSARGGISTRIRNRERLFRLAQRLTNAETALLVPDAVADWLHRQGRADLLTVAGRVPQLTARKLGAHMLQVLTAECHQPQERIADEPQGKVDRGAELLEGLA